MSIVKQERHENEIAVHAHQHEAGIQAVRTWLYARQVELNKQWPNATGEELTRLQGEAKLIAKQIELIEHGPKIKPTEGS